MLAVASASPFYSSSTTGDVWLQRGAGRQSRARGGWPSSFISKGCSPQLPSGLPGWGCWTCRGAVNGSPPYFCCCCGVAYTRQLWPFSEVICQGKVYEAGPAQPLSIPPSGIFFPPARIYRHKSNEIRKQKGGKNKLLNSLAKICG